MPQFDPELLAILRFTAGEMVEWFIKNAPEIHPDDNQKLYDQLTEFLAQYNLNDVFKEEIRSRLLTR